MAASNSVLKLSQQNWGTFSCVDGTAFSGPGKFQIYNQGSPGNGFTANGVIHVDCDVYMYGGLSGTNTWTGAGNFQWQTISVHSPGQVTFAPELLHVSTTAMVISDGATFNNQTTIIFTDASVLSYLPNILDNGTINNQGAIIFTNTTGRQSITIGGTLNNTGLFMAQNGCTISGPGGTFNNSGSFIFQSGCTFTDTGSFHNLAGGWYQQQSGNSIVPWSFLNDGIVDLWQGQFRATGGYSSSAASVTRMALGGFSPGTGYPQILYGNVALQGALAVVLTNNLVVTNGSTFILANPDALTGSFSTAQLPALSDSLAWNLIYSPTALNLMAVPSAKIKSTARLNDGRMQFTVSGIAGSACVIEASTNLTDWNLVLSNAPFGGSLDFTDTNAVDMTSRFYRSRIVQ